MNDKEDVVRLSARILAWALLAYIVFVTLGPLRDRPQLGRADVERFLAFAVTGAAFTVGYPKIWPIVVLALLAVASLLEEAQNFVPHRDAHWSDLAVKTAGVLAGVAFGLIAVRLILILLGRTRSER